MNVREAEYLGAFLHDIGKFLYRAYDWQVSHEELGEYFFEESISPVKLIKQNNSLIQTIKDSIKRRFDSVKRADIDSAKEREAEKRDSKKTLRPLISIFSRVNIGKPIPDISYYYSPEPINLLSVTKIYTREISIKDWSIDDRWEVSNIRNQHKRSYESFKEELICLRKLESFRPFFSSLYKLFEKYTSRVSSASYASVPDISLFDHSRIVAALSLCIDAGEEGKECLLIKGDISGIQNFIFYQIEEAERAGKQLRGRSFYIRILGDMLASYIIRSLNLYDANILQNNGGHFVIIAPNNAQNKEKLLAIEKKINKKLLNDFGGILQLILASKEFSSRYLNISYFEANNALEQELLRSKKKKSFSILEELMAQPGDPIEDDKFENLFIAIGKSLVHSDYLVEVNFKEQYQKGYLGNLDTEIIDFSEFGICYFFANKNTLEESLEKLKQHQYDYLIIHNIKDTDIVRAFKILDKVGLAHNSGVSFKFVGSYIPLKNTKPYTFEELSQIESENYPLLGVAKMDVDNLGTIFAFGLGDTIEKQGEVAPFSMSRIATLSRELELFFSGFINRLAEKHNIYLVYSGGDDLFAVGSWLNIIDFVRDVQEKFQKFVCNNLNITISCGTVFVKHFYPVPRFAKDVEEQLKSAKEAGKNSISAFYREVSWGAFERLVNIGKQIYSCVKNENEKDQLPRGFIHDLLSMTQKCFDSNGKLNLDLVHRVIPKLAYAFARRGVQSNDISSEEKYAEEPGISGLKKELARYFITSSDEEKKKWFENFQIPASYVLLRTRNVKQIQGKKWKT